MGKIYCYIWQGKGNNCNTSLLCHVLEGERPHVLVDPGHIRNEFGEPCFDSLVGAMEKDGFTMGDVGLVINTHSHPDHFEANELVVQRSGALVTLSQEEEEFYRLAGKGFFGFFGAKIPQVKPFFYLKEGDLSLGNDSKVVLQVLPTPGHSPGSISLYWQAGKALISGDVVFWGSVGRTDFPGGSPSLLRQSMEKLSQLDVAYLVPGHSTERGNVICGKEKVAENFRLVKMFV